MTLTEHRKLVDEGEETISGLFSLLLGVLCSSGANPIVG